MKEQQAACVKAKKNASEPGCSGAEIDKLFQPEFDRCTAIGSGAGQVNAQGNQFQNATNQVTAVVQVGA